MHYEARSNLSLALFFHLVCYSAAVELMVVKQDGIYIRLRNCTCCLQFPCRRLQITAHLCEVAEFCHPTIPPAQSISRELCCRHLTATCLRPGTFLQCTVTLTSTKALPGYGFAGPAPQTSRMPCLQH